MNIKDPSFCRLHTLFKRHFLGYKILIMRDRETVSFSTWIFKFMLRFFSWSKLSSTCSSKARNRINPTTLNILLSQLCCVPHSLGLRVTSNQFSHNIIKRSPNNLCCYHHHHPVAQPFHCPFYRSPFILLYYNQNWLKWGDEKKLANLNGQISLGAEKHLIEYSVVHRQGKQGWSSGKMRTQH